MRRSQALVDVGCVLIVASLVLSIMVVNSFNSYDDAYITYRYAYNFASGHGLVYNLDERYMGTTAPLFALALGVVGFLNPDAIPLIAGYFSSVSLFLAALALFVYGRAHAQPSCGLLAGVLFVVNPLLPLTFGGEMLPQMALILWAFVAYRQSWTRVAAVLIAVAVLTRPDAIIALAVMATHYLATRRRLPWHEVASAALVLLPFVLLSWSYYGTLLPGTLGAKLAHRDAGLWIDFTPGVIQWFLGFTVQGAGAFFPGLPAARHAIPFMVFAALGLPALSFYRFWVMPLAWIALYALGYHLLNVPFYHWYTVPIVLGLVILAACGMAGCLELVARMLARYRGLETRKFVRPSLAVLGLLILVPGLLAQLAQTRSLSGRGRNPVEVQYTRTGQWMLEHTRATDRIGYFEIGYIGYYSARRTIIDPLALVNPELAPHIARRDWLWAYEHYRPEYIIQNQRIFVPYFGRVIDEPWFREEYREVAQISEPGTLPLVIYRRTAPPQAHRPPMPGV